MDSPTIRTARPDDVPAMRAILAGHGDDGPVGLGQADVVGPYLRHLVDHHRALVTVEPGLGANAGAGADAGAVVAFGAVVDTGRAAMLSDLFVRADRLGRGLGRPLLARLLEGATRRATFASADPRALPLYVRAGMTPLGVSLYLEGDATGLAGRHGALRARDATPAECAALEAGWTGADRAADHAFWASQAAADAFAVEDGGEPVAFGYARAKQVSPARALDRLVVRPGADPVAPAIAGLARAARDGRVQASVFGPNPLLPVLLDLGFRVVDQDQYLASDPGIVDPARLLPNPGML